MPGSLIAVEVLSLVGVQATMAAFAINLVASSIIARMSQPGLNQIGGLDQQNPGSRLQVGPAGENKLPVIYGTSYVGGIVTDLSITSDNQTLYYCLSLAEVTNSEGYISGTPDTITFGDVYFGGKRCLFDGTDQYKVTGLLDESTGITDGTVAGKLEIYFYRNGSNSPVNSSTSAITLMQSSGLTYTWDTNKTMSNCAFAIIKMVYNAEAGITGLQQTKFKLTNSRTNPGDCFLDYMTSERYGAAIPIANINTSTLTALNTYSAQTVTYTTYGGGTSTLQRFKFDGLLETTQSVMNNLQFMSSCCDCLLRYNEISGTWGVIVQQPTYTVAMALTDSNLIGGIQITPLDLSATYNIVEAKFPNGSQQDNFETATFDLAVVNPSLLFPNEPVNKQSLNLPLVNDSVRAQILANRFLEAPREDLQIMVVIDYEGLQLEAGDVVSITNTNYGWSAKLFRIFKMTINYGDDGTITASLTLAEFNPAVFDDANVTQFTPAPNTGIGSPLGFGTLYAPTVTNIQISAPIPSFDLAVTAASNGVVQYAEVYYSAYASPTNSQRFFLGTTAVNPGGNPYTPSASMGVVTINTLPQGNWYFSVKYVNSLGASEFSASSAVFAWRPLTFQYSQRWLAVAYADNATGTSGFSYNPRNKAYFGLYNNATANGGTDPTLYTWYSVANFSTENYLLYANRTNRKFSFNVGNAGYVNLGGAFVPTETSVYDSNVWSGLVDPSGALQSFIDLDKRTGQTIINGTTSNNVNDGFLSVTNNTDGQMRVNLQQFLNFGAGVYTKSVTPSTLTVDVYGRVVGFSQQDNFYYTETVYTATAGQTSFSNTHTVGWILVFRDGVLLDPSEYTETSTTVVMVNACAVGETVVIIYMRGVSTDIYYEPLNITIASSTTNSITYSNAPYQIINVGDLLTFTNTGTPTTYTVQSINTTTKVITFTTTISGATAGNTVYRYRAAGSNYAPFSRYDQDVTGVTVFTPTTYAIQNGSECIYINGTQINEIDYNVTSGSLDGFPAAVTGKLTVIMYAPNNLAVPASNIANTAAYTNTGQLTYVFPSNPLSMEVYANGAILAKGAGYDYTATSANFTLTNAFNNNLTLLNQQTFARAGAA
jgi:hypothetical protein